MVDIDALFMTAVLALAVGVVSFILAKTVVAEPWRKWARSRSEWLGKLAGCPLCTSVWITFASTAVFQQRILNVGGWRVPFVYAVTIFAQVALSTWIIGMMTKAITAPQAADPNPKPANRKPAVPQTERQEVAGGYSQPRTVPYDGRSALTGKTVAEGGKPIGRLVSKAPDSTVTPSGVDVIGSVVGQGPTKSEVARRTLANSTPAKASASGWDAVGRKESVSGYCPGTAAGGDRKHADCKVSGDHYAHSLDKEPTGFTRVKAEAPRSVQSGKPVPGPTPDEKPVTVRSAAATALKYQDAMTSKNADSKDSSPEPGTPA